MGSFLCPKSKLSPNFCANGVQIKKALREKIS
jgi:hypothetical protein